jgi:hypothetical protein
MFVVLWAEAVGRECKTPNTSEVDELNKVQYSYGMFPFD